ncbi:beta-glucan synthesis-associated [Testicularia cyperi]|uniref:Beta-glucan synthesis-associated n=1 Tax=Testicularia cyperi TaxID=1882483 RepID=A0A317XKM9_9BASI|nr:beta-glucan synthesis-associated [Testicularia cyperi]
MLLLSEQSLLVTCVALCRVGWKQLFLKLYRYDPRRLRPHACVPLRLLSQITFPSGLLSFPFAPEPARNQAQSIHEVSLVTSAPRRPSARVDKHEPYHSGHSEKAPSSLSVTQRAKAQPASCPSSPPRKPSTILAMQVAECKMKPTSLRSSSSFMLSEPNSPSQSRVQSPTQSESSQLRLLSSPVLPYANETPNRSLDSSRSSRQAIARYINVGMHRPLSSVPSDERINPRGVRDTFGLPASLAGSTENTSCGSPSIGESALLFASPFSWDTMDGKEEPDDDLHRPDDPIGPTTGFWGAVIRMRGFLNVGVLLVLASVLLLLFAGFPILSYYTRHHETTKGGFNLGGANASGQIGSIPGMRSTLIDPDTPQEFYTTLSPDGTKTLKLVFSDEFNTPGRSFYPGDDPFWEASDLHYWATNNYEWYSPEAVGTNNGKLEITLAEAPTNDLYFRGGFLTSWNKFCFTGGYLVASVQLPGYANVAGLWPAFWAMGNLGRAGYGATTDGTWPYSYTACDVGTLLNQTDADGNPAAVATGGDVMWNRKYGSKALSFLPGQRLSACTCPGEDHPGPKLSDGSWAGRSAPEIDVFEAQVDGTLGMTVSQSMQTAPFNMYYNLTNSSGPAYEFYKELSHINIYNGQNDQQALSGISLASQEAVQRGGNDSYAIYGFDWSPGMSGHIDWVSDGQHAWRANAAALEGDPVSQISARPVPEEPMYIIFNLGISENFGHPEWDKVRFPATMKVDWVRVYQDENAENVGCDPPDHPTAAYIERHHEAYYNANYTVWGGKPEEGGYGGLWPRNRLYPDGCNAPTSTEPGSPVKPYPQASPVPSSEIALGQSRRRKRRRHHWKT